MCLSVHLGSHTKLEIQDIPEGSLGIEPAIRTPPSLKSFPFVYRLGRKSAGASLECSCLLAQHIDYTETGLSVFMDELYFLSPVCPFRQLRSYIEMALSSGQQVDMVCDDLSDADQEYGNDDYDHLLLNSAMISPESYLFVDPTALFPWRVFQCIPGKQ